MEAKVIIVSVVKSNKSENNVWAVGITGEEQEQAYCKSAWKAMRFAFLLKKQTGFYIEDDSLKMLSEEIALQKSAAAEAEQPAEQEVRPEAEQQAVAEAKPKKARASESKDNARIGSAESSRGSAKAKARKPRTKKVQAEPEAEVAVMAPVAQSELLAFV